MAAPDLIPKKDRVDLRLFNTIAIFDVYVVSRDPEAARQALLAAITNGAAPMMEITATESRRQASIRASWLDQPPFVATDVTDDEFQMLKGITTSEAFSRFYEKR